MSEPPPDPTRALEAPYRSRGEAQIARMLARHGLPFSYEQPIAVLDEGKTRIWYPDFQLRDQGIVIEYCGRTGDSAYSDGVAHKQAVYAANGLTALMITPEIFRGSWTDVILGYLESIATERLEATRAARHSQSSASQCGFSHSTRE